MFLARPHPMRCLQREARTLLFADVVESVRLFQEDEAAAVARWIELVAHIEADLVPRCGGRLVQRFGDGVLAEFHEVGAALAAAFAIQHASHRGNRGLSADRHILLRVGIEVAEVFLAQEDVLGHGVNLAQRIATLAGPGEIVVSARVRERITPDLDGDVEDLGECYLKHVQEPVRLYRVGPPGPRPPIEAGFSSGELYPAVAVVPFATSVADRDGRTLGEALAEELIGELSRSPDLAVISRLSTAPFRGRDTTAEEIGAHLRANYILSGRYAVDGGAVRLCAELSEAKSGRILWTHDARTTPAGILAGERELIGELVRRVRSSMAARELQRARSQPLPTLQSYTLLMAAISLMHSSLRDFEEARHLLLTLTDRARRQPVPNAWLARWHVLRVNQGWSPDPRQDALSALECTKRALDADPDCSLALAMEGFVHTNVLRRLDIAQERYDRAIATNPSDSLAWLLKGTMRAFVGDGPQAIEDTRRALRLSPLDPHQHYYESLSGTARLAAGDYEGALRHGCRALRQNATHTSTLRLITVSQWRLGLCDDARRTVERLLRLDPGLTVSRYLERHPAALFRTGQDWADALRGAGVPN
jgi:adenylate cyclase